MIVLLVHPLHTWLRHKRVPEGLALVVLLLAIFGVLVVLGSILVLAVGRLVTVLPQYAGRGRRAGQQPARASSSPRGSAATPPRACCRT